MMHQIVVSGSQINTDRIVVLDQGIIVAQGTRAELVDQDGLYAELARLQFAA